MAAGCCVSTNGAIKDKKKGDLTVVQKSAPAPLPSNRPQEKLEKQKKPNVVKRTLPKADSYVSYVPAPRPIKKVKKPIEPEVVEEFQPDIGDVEWYIHLMPNHRSSKS